MKEELREKKPYEVKTLARKEEMVMKFLLEEYSQCFSQMRHYDNIRISLMAFVFSFYASIGTVAFAVYQFFSEKKLSAAHGFLGLLSLFAFSMGLIIVLMLTKNRKYFVLVARQINEIRNVFFPRETSDLKVFLPTDSSQPIKFDLRSTHLLSISLLLLIDSFAMFFAVFFLTSYLRMDNQLCMALICLPLAFIAQFQYVRTVLKEDKIEADKSE